MDLLDAVKLIENGVEKSSAPQLWADLGAGDGLFTNALSIILASGSKIYAIDINPSSLARIILPTNGVELIKIQGDFTSAISELDQLDGVVLANSLHFIRDKKSFLINLKLKLKQEAHLIAIEYDMRSANAWVPFPITFDALRSLLTSIGFFSVQKIGERKSVYNSSMIYSIVASSQ